MSWLEIVRLCNFFSLSVETNHKKNEFPVTANPTSIIWVYKLLLCPKNEFSHQQELRKNDFNPISSPALFREVRCSAKWYYEILHNLIFLHTYLGTIKHLWRSILPLVMSGVREGTLHAERAPTNRSTITCHCFILNAGSAYTKDIVSSRRPCKKAHLKNIENQLKAIGTANNLLIKRAFIYKHKQ